VVGSVFTANPAAGSLTITGHAPSVQSSHVLAPSAGSIVITGYAPSVVAGHDVLLQTGNGSLVIVGHPPSFSAHFAAAANDGHLAIIGYPPSLAGEQVINTLPGTLAIQGYPPFVIHLPVPERRRFHVEHQDRVDEVETGGRLVPAGEADRQHAVTGRRRVFRVNRRS
jgi:hypothetical protein